MQLYGTHASPQWLCAAATIPITESAAPGPAACLPQISYKFEVPYIDEYQPGHFE